MMFTAELKINGSLIGVLYGHNLDRMDDKGRTLYEYSYWEPMQKEAIEGTIAHFYGEGLDTLVSAILRETSEQRLSKWV